MNVILISSQFLDTDVHQGLDNETNPIIHLILLICLKITKILKLVIYILCTVQASSIV